MAQRSEPFACLTCYDATTARWLEKAGVHVLLVGDTAAEVILGFDRTIDMPLEILLALTAAVKRGAPNTVIMADISVTPKYSPMKNIPNLRPLYSE